MYILSIIGITHGKIGIIITKKIFLEQVVQKQQWSYSHKLSTVQI